MLATDFIIRQASPNDAEVLSEYMNALADENLEQLSGLRPSPEEERSFLRKASENGRAFVLIALAGASVIGMLDLWSGEKLYNRHTALLGMSVLAPYRRKGIGRKLVQSAIDETRKWPGFCRTELHVTPWNEPAIRLYESAGFLREGTMRKAANLRGRTTDLILMSLVW